MGNKELCVSGETTEEGSAFLMSLIRRFETGVTEGHLHTLIYVAQKLNRLAPTYSFQFQQLVPFCEDLDLRIAMLLWNNAVRIKDNRIRSCGRPAADGQAPNGASLDKLIALSYDDLKFLAAILHLEQDLQKTRREALTSAVRVFPIREDDAKRLLESCSG